MSGAESLAIFSIACNVMQVISFAHESITFFKNLKHEGCADLSLRKAASQMRDAAKSLVDSINVNGGNTQLTIEEVELLEVANECSRVAKKLSDELNKLKNETASRTMSGTIETPGSAQGARKMMKTSLWGTVRLGGRTWWKKGEIERLEKDLNRAQKIMETRILIRICNKHNSTELQHQQDFLQLNEALQHFINGCSNGNIKLEQLIKTEADSVKARTTDEHDKTRVQINDHIDEEHRNTKREVVQQIGETSTREHEETRDLVSGHLERLRIEDNKEHAKTRSHVNRQIQNMQATTLSASVRDKLLKSLNFQGRDQRFNDVKEAHYKTFQWLFGEVKSTEGFLQDDEREASDDEHETSDDVHETSDDERETSDHEHEASDDDTSYQSSNSNELLDEAQGVDLVYEDLVEECRGRVMNNFSDWLKSKEVVFWIKAKAGAGKSTLVKFLYNDSRTVQLLDSTTPGKTLILIHFFYLMGSPMQCNIKGLLCTLLYQFLQQDEDGTWTAELFRQISSLKNKELGSNWSEAELKKALSIALRLATGSHQICIFLDGLDEVHQSDGKHKLLNLLDWLIASGLVRLCVLSRPEEEFNQALSSASILELHDLTAPDMYQYARDLLAPLTTNLSGSVPSEEACYIGFRTTYYIDTLQSLAKKIVSKSDGVFLWADIATRSLQRGITYGDTWSTIEQRLDQMPMGLSELYASMWSRPGEDIKLYEAEAALCFNLVLDWKLCFSHNSYKCWDPKHLSKPRALSTGTGCFCGKIYRAGLPPNLQFSLFHLALAKHQVLRPDLSFGTVPPTDVLWSKFVRLYKRLPILCAGLLETTGQLSYVDEFGHEVRNPDIPVRFLHRTANEFFKDTVEGREILRSDTSSFEKRLSALLQSSYSRGLAFRPSSAHERELFCLPLATVNAYEMVGVFHTLRTRLEGKEWLEELDACRAFIDNGNGIIRPGQDFLGLAIQWGYQEYLEHFFNNLSCYTPAYKSYLLVCGSSIRSGGRPVKRLSQDPKHWAIQDLTRGMEIIKYLLTQGCKSEPTIVLNPLTYKVTGLEEFFWSLSDFCRRDNWGKDSAICDLIIETLRHFSESGADFMQPVYGFYGYDRLCESYPSGTMQIPLRSRSWGGLQNYLRPLNQVVVEWSILGALTHAVKTPHRDDHPRGRLEELLITIRTDKDSLDPKIIAHKQRLMNTISKWISHNDEDAATKIEKLEDELNQIASSILNDSDVPEGIFEYFLELGFMDSWPRFLADELMEMGFTLRRDDEDDKWKLPDGVIYPPVKFVDQLK
ncbi:hypothetical protein N431DRAFT_375985 [Stipitochalara longipes BDJ]|nr:hypothetical protein N431DRAFT_375985 [Stipitochalara longipes BDJ]